MKNESMLNSSNPVKRAVLGVSLADINAYRNDPSKPELSAVPGPKGGYLINASTTVRKQHQNWCKNWRASMGFSNC